ncbi:platelet-activating factor acetylhydrolase 2, cytoplasmic-like [Tachypleus tridentatus]|uniref:platelet-activating factor acetylhydrolase 2, cytoplasmic-like n=1 Tax=Tachypleus tridentatus TaxID=6853 RepID=UPI003FCF7C69
MGKEKKLLQMKLRHCGKWHLPLASGPYTVGCTDIMTGYSKTGVFMRLFYPAAHMGILKRSSQWPTVIPHPLYVDGIANFINYPRSLIRILHRRVIGNVYIPALWNAMPLRCEELFPVIVFSHGMGGCRTSYSTIASELASQGYVVACLEHRDHSACLSYYFKKARVSSRGTLPGADLSEIDFCEVDGKFDWESCDEEKDENEDWEDLEDDLEEVDGNIKESSRISLGKANGIPDIVKEWVFYRRIRRKKDEYTIRNKQAKQRARDCSHALDILEDLNVGRQIKNILDHHFDSALFQGTMNLSKAAVAGHSFGGSSVILALAMELRFKLGLALDCWMYPLKENQDLFSMVTQPILFINMEKFQTWENLNVMKNLESEEIERKVVTIKGTVHKNQTDIVFCCGPVLRLCFGAWSKTNRFTAMNLTTREMMVFLAKHLGRHTNVEHEAYLKRKEHIIREGIRLKKRRMKK